MTTPIFSKNQEAKVVELIDRICSTSNVNPDGSSMSDQQIKDRADLWAKDGDDILTNGGDVETLDPAFFEEVEEYFKSFEEKEHKVENKKEFQKIESFIREEKKTGKQRREEARLLAASEEVRIAAEVAELKAHRINQHFHYSQAILREKVLNAEKSHNSRKLVISKSARTATSDCRTQFKRVREFFQTLHDDRRAKLRRQYERSVKIQALLHRLRKTDPRVMQLQQQTAERIFKKKETDMIELNMVQNLEESTYLETIIAVMDDLQAAKECAADDYFKLQIKNLKQQQVNMRAREKEATEFKAKSMLEMAELISKYIKRDFEDREDEQATKEMVETTERRKDFEASGSNILLSVSDLYDTILWSVATGSLGLTSSDTDSFNSYFDDDEDDDEEEEKPAQNETNDAKNKLADDDLAGVEPTTNKQPALKLVGWRDDTGSVQTGSVSVQTGSVSARTASVSAHSKSTTNTTDLNTPDNLSPAGHIFVKELRRSIREKEKKMEKRHLAERKAERKKYRAEAKKLKEHHQAIIDRLLADCGGIRQKLRDAISRRMVKVEQQQSRSTQTLQEEIEASVEQMEKAWAEHKRLEEEQKDAFAKAQALVSAQVFHEVRNALSSVVAMSEMTSSLQKDPTVTSEALVDSVSDMLDQNKEVVNYSLNMLNNILDVSKINAGSFETQKSFFDIQDLVSRATAMQSVKAQTRGVKISFTPLPEPQIAYSDEDIVSRIITNFISNAVKFTTAGAVQPFVCPLEDLDPSLDKTKTKSVRIDNASKETVGANDEDDPVVTDVKYIAVGVADTGPGLSKELLRISQAGLFNSDGSKVNSGAKNSGFGLHLAHQLAGALGSLLHLKDLETFKKFCNSDIGDVLDDSDSLSGHDSLSEAGSVYSDDVPGKGTVLYITIPVVRDGARAVSMFQAAPGAGHGLGMAFKQYAFSPKPAPTSADGTFRILVADDVVMLRKGLVRSVLDIFKKLSDCPVSVSTACTAEDALRAIASNAYDMFICDNQFATSNHLRRLSPECEKSRKKVVMGDTRSSIAEFFKTESFTIAPGDGAMLGQDACVQLAQYKNNSNSIPILVLHSGHQIELPRELGIIVVRKPLKREGFVPLFEHNAENLIETGMCVEVKQGNDTVVRTRSGAQLFIKQDSMMPVTNRDTEGEGGKDEAMDNIKKVRKRNASDGATKRQSSLDESKGGSAIFDTRSLKRQKQKSDQFVEEYP